MSHPRHDSRIPSHAIFGDGFAIGSYDLAHCVYRFRWYDEDYTVPYDSIHAEVHQPWGWLAPIDEVRSVAAESMTQAELMERMREGATVR